jgi:hypothetical protein
VATSKTVNLQLSDDENGHYSSLSSQIIVTSELIKLYAARSTYERKTRLQIAKNAFELLQEHDCELLRAFVEIYTRSIRLRVSRLPGRILKENGRGH